MRDIFGSRENIFYGTQLNNEGAGEFYYRMTLVNHRPDPVNGNGIFPGSNDNLFEHLRGVSPTVNGLACQNEQGYYLHLTATQPQIKPERDNHLSGILRSILRCIVPCCDIKNK